MTMELMRAWRSIWQFARRHLVLFALWCGTVTVFTADLALRQYELAIAWGVTLLMWCVAGYYLAQRDYWRESMDDAERLLNTIFPDRQWREVLRQLHRTADRERGGDNVRGNRSSD